MRHNKNFNHLGRQSAHRKALLANMAASLILHKRINTTVAKAKALKMYVEPVITRAKEDTTHSRRMAFSYLKDKQATAELFREIAPKIANRPGGYTRILKTGFRPGDAADMCIIELVDFNENYNSGAVAKTKTRRSRGGAKTAATATPATAAPAPAPAKGSKAAEVKTTVAAPAAASSEEAVVPAVEEAVVDAVVDAVVEPVVAEAALPVAEEAAEVAAAEPAPESEAAPTAPTAPTAPAEEAKA